MILSRIQKRILYIRRRTVSGSREELSMDLGKDPLIVKKKMIFLRSSIGLVQNPFRRRILSGYEKIRMRRNTLLGSVERRDPEKDYLRIWRKIHS